MNKIKIIYRISDAGYRKTKPSYINNENCLKNAFSVFPFEKYDWSFFTEFIGIFALSFSCDLLQDSLQLFIVTFCLFVPLVCFKICY